MSVLKGIGFLFVRWYNTAQYLTARSGYQRSMKSSSAPVTLVELLRLALPAGAEFVGRADQQARVVKWAVVVHWPLSSNDLDIEPNDLVLLSGESVRSERRLRDRDTCPRECGSADQHRPPARSGHRRGTHE